MDWLKTIGWFLTVVPPICLLGFSFWMIKALMNDDDNVKTFVLVCLTGWFIGVGILILTYYTDLAKIFVG